MNVPAAVATMEDMVARKELTIMLPLPVETTRQVCAEACQELARRSGWSLSEAGDARLVCQEPRNWLSVYNPVRLEIDLRTATPGTTAIDLTCSSIGFGPLQNSHVSKQASVTEETITRLASQRPREQEPAAARIERERPAPDTPPINPIFLSYRREDSADVTGRIYDRLVQRFGQNAIFKDVHSIPLGTDFKDYIGSMVGRCKLLLAVIGPQWLTISDEHAERRLDEPGDFVRLEIESALKRHIPVIPLMVRGATMPSAAALPPALRDLAYRNGTVIRPDPDFHRDVDRLIAAIEPHFA